MFNRLAQFRRIKTPNQIRHFVNYLIWELNILVHADAEGQDYVDAQGKRYLNAAEARTYDALMEQCWHVDVFCLKEAVTLETRAKTLLQNIQDDEFLAGHDAAETAQEWARTSIPLHLMEGY